MIRVLGMSGSPRVGNSEYLLSEALAAAEQRGEKLGVEVHVKQCTIRGKKLSGCVMCQKCMSDGVCAIKDDFGELQALWHEADVILYSIPVYHMGIPAQLKAFLDRLGNSRFGLVNSLRGGVGGGSQKTLQVVGAIAQGIHIFSGQEHTITQVINHAMISGAIPVAGDKWESYIGVGGWTRNEEGRNALEEQYGAGVWDAQIAVESSRTLGINAVDMALIIQRGFAHCPDLGEEEGYFLLRQRVERGLKE